MAEAVSGAARVEAPVKLAVAGELTGGRERVYQVVLIRAGEWRGKGLRCPAAVLQRAAGKFEGLASFLNPPPPQAGEHGYPALERLLGTVEAARWDDQMQGIVAEYRLADTDAARWFGRLIDDLLAAKGAGRPVPNVGLSAVPWCRIGPDTGADGLREVREIVSVEQVDAVYRPAAGGEFVRILNADGAAAPGAEMQTEPAGELLDVTRVCAADGTPADGMPGGLRFRALVFRAAYPNGRFVRFRADDLPALAASFAQAPFLRDHNAWEVEARGGTVLAGAVVTGADGVPGIEVEVELVRPRDIADVQAGLIDRFSIGFGYASLTCSICGSAWLTGACRHWPGETYRGELCELIVEQPRGREVSGVNVPAVAGTKIVGMLAADGPSTNALTNARMDAADEPPTGAATDAAQVAAALPELQVAGWPVAEAARDGVSRNLEPADLQPAGVVAAAEVAGDGAMGSTGGRHNGVAPDNRVARRNFVAREGEAMAETTTVHAPVGAGEMAAGSSTDDARALMHTLRESVLDTRLAAAGLPPAFQRLVREGLPAAWRLADLDAEVSRVKAAWAEEESQRTVTGIVPAVTGLQDSVDQISEAITAMVEGRSPRGGVRALSGIREAYLLLSGDYEMTGLFHPERVQLANVNSTTMANIVANVLNKVVVAEFQSYPRWWEPIVRRETFNSLQTIKWILLGGVGELPLVSEGAAYTELTWDDAAQSASWQKRGGYLGITLEAMDKDDVGRLRNAPRALAQAAWLTIGKAVAGIFTDSAGVGPTLADSKALFHADHGNLGSAALDNTSWAAARLAMRKQTEVNSGERLGGLATPKYLLVPPDLENAALTVLASEGLPGTANNDINPEAAGNTRDARMDAARRRILVVDLWTDTKDWAAVADPRLYPTIGLGFRYGETPEIFSVASPTSGLMFSNDVLPVKVRWFFAAGPMDYRGLYKANVA